MSNHTIQIKGSQIFANPSIGTNHSDNTMTVHSATPFLNPESDVKVVVTEDFGAVLWIYVDGVKYPPQNPGQTGTIQQDLSGLGECYLRFNGVFPGLPGQMILFTTEVDGNWPATFSGGPFCGCNVPCFDGDVELLRWMNDWIPVLARDVIPGDRLKTFCGGSVEVVWTGKSVCTDALYDVNGDLFTGQHRIWKQYHRTEQMRSEWIPAKKIGEKILLTEPTTVYSIMTKQHSCLVTKSGTMCESMLVRARVLAQFSTAQQDEILSILMPISTQH